MLHAKRGIANPKDYAGIPMTKRKFTELELSLLHLQQNVKIPQTHLIHPTIQRSLRSPSIKNPPFPFPHPPQTPKRLNLPKHTPRTRKVMDQVHTGCDEIE